MAIQWLRLDCYLAAVREEFPELNLVRPRAIAYAMHAAETAYYYDGEGDICVLAARYAERVLKDHPFADDNKRCGLLACLGFLGINGITIAAKPEALADAIVHLASGELSAEEFAAFLGRHQVV